MVEWNNEVINWNLGRSYIPKNTPPTPTLYGGYPLGMPLHFAPQMMSKVGRKEDKLMNE
jgi:hypothetical protein